MIEDIKKEFGRLDVLVNNAGICQDRTLAKMTKEEWQRVIDIDLTGVFNCSKAALSFSLLIREISLILLRLLESGEILVRQIMRLLKPELLVLQNL